MKKETNKKPVIAITATLSETRLLKKLVERLASHNHKGENAEPSQPGWRTFHTSSIEAFVSGHISVINDETGITKLPFVKSFFFTCLYAGKGEYNMVWGCSLS